MKIVLMKIREFELGDFRKGIFETLSALKETPEISDKEMVKWWSNHYKPNPMYKIFVAIESGTVIGSVTCLLESKLLGGISRVAHIEDVAVCTNQQGRGVGAKLLKFVIESARTENCYKVILNCSDDRRSFYEKFGFISEQNHMRLNL
jgi:glucosamine-phosphate N-acetyltransferase